MDPAALYLATIDDLERLANAGDAYSMLRASAMLRQLLLDTHPLVHVVNRKLRVKFSFTVCGRAFTRAVLKMNPDLFCALDGIHAASSGMPNTAENLKLQEFLAEPILKVGSQLLTVRDLIEVSANALGGVHFDPKRADTEALAVFSAQVKVREQSLDAAQMRPLVLAVLDGLAPVTQAVRREQGRTRQQSVADTC
jgi:hypothetical protein